MNELALSPSDIERSLHSCWYLETVPKNIAISFSEVVTSEQLRNFVQPICAALLELEPRIKPLEVQGFEHWKSNTIGYRWTIGYLQTHQGKRIMDTRFFLNLEVNTFTHSLEKTQAKYLFQGGSSLVRSKSLFPDEYLLSCSEISFQLITHPRYNPHASVPDMRGIEKIIDNALEHHRTHPQVREVIRGKTQVHLEMLIPSHSPKHDTEVQLHKGIHVSVGNQYIKSNPFEQFLYFTIDLEAKKVVKIIGYSSVTHATMVDGRDVNADPFEERQKR